MAEPSTGGNEDRKVARVNSFSKILRSPSRSKSKSTSSSSPSNPLSRLNPAKFFGRKNSVKSGSESGRRTTSAEEEIDHSGEMNPSTLLNIASKAVQVIEDVVMEKMTSQTQTDNKGEANSTTTSIDTSTDKDKKFDYLEKALEGIEKTMNELEGKAKEVMGKGKEALDKETLERGHDINESAPTSEVKAPNVVERVKEEVVVVVSAIQSSTKEEETFKEKEEEKEDQNKEDNCMISLAQGLQNVCAPWSVKKED